MRGYKSGQQSAGATTTNYSRMALVINQFILELESPGRLKRP
jgi:hypothetical protein